MSETNHAETLVNGDRILPSLLKDIEGAERTVHVSMFLFFRDPIGEQVAGALMAKARAGVTVRVLVNVAKTAMGDPFSTSEKAMMEHDPDVREDPLDVAPLCDEMRAAGVEVVDTNIDYDKEVVTSDARIRSIAAQIRGAISVDDLHVDHRKLVVIDGRVAYCGGANVGAQYLYHVPFEPGRDARAEAEDRRAQGLPEPWWKWHDSLTRFEGPIARDLDECFRERWILDGGREFQPVEPVPSARRPRGLALGGARVVTNEPNTAPNDVRELYLAMIRGATRSIFIENPYLYHHAIVEALCEARRLRPDLDVTLVVPASAWNDNAFGQDAQEHHYAAYLACGVAVYEYQNHFNHLKMAVFDGRWTIVGSTNLNYRSLEDDKDFELVVLVDDEDFARATLAAVRDVDVLHARRVEREDVEGSFAALRVRVRDPRTLLLISRRVL